MVHPVYNQPFRMEESNTEDWPRSEMETKREEEMKRMKTNLAQLRSFSVWLTARLALAPGLLLRNNNGWSCTGLRAGRCHPVIGFRLNSHTTPHHTTPLNRNKTDGNGKEIGYLDSLGNGHGELGSTSFEGHPDYWYQFPTQSSLQSLISHSLKCF